MNKNSTKNKTKKISQKENETSKILQLLDSLEAEQYGTKSKTAQLGKTEQSLEALSQTVAGHTTSIGNHTNAIQNLSSKAVAQGYAIDALQGKDLDHDTAIATNTANIATNTANIATNASGILALQSGKQDKLTAGQNVTIQNNTISASVDTSALQPKLTAGANITIDQNNQISATNTTYTAGTNINIDANNVISATGGGSSSVTASNVDSESATSGQVLTADGQGGATWQTVSGGSGGCDCAGDIAFLRDYATGIDIYRTCVAPTTYPVGTIFQTYDCYERELSCTKYTTGNLPKILFCVEPNSTGKIN